MRRDAPRLGICRPVLDSRGVHLPLGRLALPMIGVLVAGLALVVAPAQADDQVPPAQVPPASSAPAADGEAEADGDAGEAASAALDEVQSILDPTPAQAAEQEDAPAAGKDLTLALRDLQLRMGDLSARDRARAATYANRPPQTYRWTSERTQQFGKVLVHWQNGQVTQAYVGQVGAVAQHVLATYTAAGYRAPLSDGTRGGGSGLLDIYLVDFEAAGQPGLYGYCGASQSSPSGGPYSVPAFCALDHNYTSFPQRTPLQNLQVTAAHELFHATQFAYDVREDGWFMEATATWAEDEVYDSINDNRQYLGLSPLAQPRQSLDQFTSNYRQYGEWIFFRYLSERFPRSQGGLPLIVRSIWQRADSTRGARNNLYSVQAIGRELRSRGTTLARFYAAFGDANRRPARTYEEGRAYPKARPARKWTFTTKRHTSGRVSTRLDHLATTTVAVLPSRAMKRWRLRVSVDLPATVLGSAAVLTRYDKAGRPTRHLIRLTRAGNGVAAVRFDSRNTSKVELTLSNAGVRYASCGHGPVRTSSGNFVEFSCAGLPRDNGRTMRYRISAVR
jgi:hypothetical protein